MAEQRYFSHTSQDGRSPWDRAEAAGYPSPTGENIAKGQESASEVMQAWMESDGHRDNILNCASHAMGLGVTRDGDGVLVWVQMFGAE
jgi:uncharacterized protein YkwD